MLKYLDEVGFSLSLPLSYTWRPEGSPLAVPKHWGAAGRLNLIGTLSCSGETRRLEYWLLEARCRAAEVGAYLGRLAEQAQRSGQTTVVVLDNAGFHRAKLIREQRETWAAQGLTLWFQPPYSPQFNLVETVWKTLKGDLMPRRAYASRDELQAAVLAALNLLGAIPISQN